MFRFLSHRLKKGTDEEAEGFLFYANPCYYKRKMPKLFSVLLLTLLSCASVLAPHFLFRSSSSLSLLHTFGARSEDVEANLDAIVPLCSSIPKGTICCDRRHPRSDVCVMKGDVRARSASSSVFVYSSNNKNSSISNIVAGISNGEHEKIKPYTWKWETSVMDTIDELNLVSRTPTVATDHRCDVVHDVPALFFSTGGYTGNLYHEFNDGILPLYATSQHLNKQVVFVILEYHSWWIMKYRDVLSELSDYPPIDFSGDNRTHCFPEAIAGLRVHDYPPNDFREVLDRGYWPRIRALIQEEKREAQERLKRKISLNSSSEPRMEASRPKLVVQARNGSRAITIQEEKLEAQERSDSLRGPIQEDKLEAQEILKQTLSLNPSSKQGTDARRPKLVVQARNGSRAISNQELLVKVAKEIGFEVLVLSPGRTTELAKIYRALNSSEVMVGVHGAALTHYLFLKPGSVFIQIIPLGTDWAAEVCFGEPARKIGLKYVGYKIHPKESSLYGEYEKDDPVLVNPESVNEKGWQFTKKIYLDVQTVNLDLRRFRRRLVRTYGYSMSRINDHLQSW